MRDFDVCECGLVFSTEVYELFTSVNEAILPKFIESLIDSFGNFWIESKSKTIPVA